MTRKIFRSIVLAVIVVLVASFALTLGALYQYFTGLSRRQLHTEVSLAAQGVEREGLSYFDGLDTSGYRITWVASDGSVLYDNTVDAGQMENHAQREEIREAEETGFGESQRYSGTMMERLLYTAKRLQDGSVLRVAVSQYSIFMLLMGLLQPFIVTVVLATVLSLFLAARLSKRIVKPLNEIDLDHPLENDGYDELTPLLHRIDFQQTELDRRKGELLTKQKELDAILSNMSEGMILLTESARIVTINPAAGELLGADGDCAGKSFLTVTRNIEIQDAVQTALRGERAEKVVPIGDNSYQISAAPVESDGAVIGAAVIMIDVTEREQSEEMRREFSANVSHELKTPLHSISGYAELMKDGLVRKEDVRPFAGRIYQEAQRAIQLVQDIISLSHLDENANDMKREKTDLYAQAAAAVQRLSSQAEQAGVELTITGSPAEMVGVPDLLETITYNLCDNAIRYNHWGGKVRADVHVDGDDQAVLTVEDDGIGIPKKDQKRIFERFYRVDKSHSRAVGGTGLGLSIVKHAVLIHHGKIRLVSEVGKGTRITVLFPRDLDVLEPVDQIFHGDADGRDAIQIGAPDEAAGKENGGKKDCRSGQAGGKKKKKRSESED